MEQKELFKAFHGGTFGPSHYYYIVKDDHKYLFKYGLSKDGAMMFSNSDKFNTMSKGEDDYLDFINHLKSLTSEWSVEYYDSDVLDGIQWNINFIEDNLKYSGSNNFPANYKEVINYINECFTGNDNN